MLNTEADPRVYFAAERTLLAWIRTGMTIMALGFVVARFGLFLRLLRLETAQPAPTGGVSPYLGAMLVVIGVVAISAGTTRYRDFCRLLGPAMLPSPHAEVLPLIMGWSLAALGAVLFVILLT
jgi:putative membrane protein